MWSLFLPLLEIKIEYTFNKTTITPRQLVYFSLLKVGAPVSALVPSVVVLSFKGLEFRLPARFLSIIGGRGLPAGASHKGLLEGFPTEFLRLIFLSIAAIVGRYDEQHKAPHRQGNSPDLRGP